MSMNYLFELYIPELVELDSWLSQNITYIISIYELLISLYYIELYIPELVELNSWLSQNITYIISIYLSTNYLSVLY